MDFLFAPEGYDKEDVLSYLKYLGASQKDILRIRDVIDNEEQNTGFTFVSPYESTILVGIGPSETGDEFTNTLSHEIHHLAVAIADNLGVNLRGEEPAYLHGDTVQALFDIICELGCPRCHTKTVPVKN